MQLRVRVTGRPAPQGSHDVGANGHVMHSSKYLATWRRAVNRAVRAEYLRLGLTFADMPLIPAPRPVYVDITHYVTDDQCRAAGTDEPTGAPDYDKLLRASTDGLGDARAFTNDSQITDGATRKRRIAPGAAPGAYIIVSDEPLDGGPLEVGEISAMTTQYRIVLEEITDVDGERGIEVLAQATDTAEALADVWLPAIARKLGGTQPARARAEEADSFPQTPSTGAAEAPKRKRRTKAEIEADRLAEAAASANAPDDEDATSPEPAAAAMPGPEVPRFNPFAS